jgi:hypothetical protein
MIQMDAANHAMYAGNPSQTGCQPQIHATTSFSATSIS